MTKPKIHRTLAARLLDEVLLRTGWDADALSRGLGLTANQLEAYRSGVMRMSVDQQLALAEFVLSRIPECARMARRLISQGNAEAAFLAKETTTHMAAPPSQFWR
jgi:hypothetical protein